MPDTSNMSIMAIANGRDAMSILSNNASAINSRTQNTNRNGEDFSAVIDQTAMSIMAGAATLPTTMSGQFAQPVISDNRTYTAVETSARSAAPRGNDYTQQTQMGEGTRTDTGRLEAHTESDFSQGLQTAVDTAGEQMTGEAAERLDITPEELAEAMDFVGLTPEDLLTEDGLTDLVMAVSGEDHAALLTDGELYGDWQALVETAEDLKVQLAEDFGMTIGELDETIAAMQEMSVSGETVAAVTEEVPDEMIEMQQTAPLQIAPEEAPRAHAEKAAEETDEANPYNTRLTPAQEEVARPVQAQQTGNETGAQTRQQQQSAQTQVNPAAAAETIAQAQSTAEGFLNSVNEALAGTTPYTTTQTPDAQDVLRQVLDYMRSTVREGMTELEMQLNPQSLGRVHVTLQAMDGGEMVARFAAQNDQVREALANQMPELLQRFQEQGIKVNEVEVTVAQHGYDQQRQDTEAREDRQREQEAAIGRMGRMNRVRIDLASMSAEDIASLDEGERIEAEMMAAEGNTVNYKA